MDPRLSRYDLPLVGSPTASHRFLPVDTAIAAYQAPKQTIGISARAQADLIRNQYHLFALLEPYLETPTGTRSPFSLSFPFLE